MNLESFDKIRPLLKEGDVVYRCGTNRKGLAIEDLSVVLGNTLYVVAEKYESHVVMWIIDRVESLPSAIIHPEDVVLYSHWDYKKKSYYNLLTDGQMIL